MKLKAILALALVSLAITVFAADPVPMMPRESKEHHAARMAWWHEGKFGLFIHWGVYSVPAGFYHGQPVAGIGEWIMNRGKIPMTKYQQFTKEFNPVKFNADHWVRAAKDAGMRYIVMTSKHHDGFAMFDTKAGVAIALPAAAPDPIASVICLDLMDEIPKVNTKEN